MKNFIKKIAVLVTIITLIASMTACTYIKDGYEWQDVTLTFNYQDDEGNEQTLNSTLSLTVNVTTQTTQRVLGLIKDGFYENTAVVIDSEFKYIELGAFTYEDGAYKDIISEMSTIKGEFKNNGVLGTYKAQAGSIVMLRNEDNQEEGGYLSYDTAMYKFAIMLTDDALNGKAYSVFGKIDDASLEVLAEIIDTEREGEDGKIRKRYLGDKDETNGNLILNEGRTGYVNSLEYFMSTELNSDLFYANGDKIGDASGVDDEDVYQKLIKASQFDVVALPFTPIIVKNFKIK
ncbi:MAG: peptidylprolyl isomerase [Clostridia bacterium]|nr:peptidylprolyl isomerase [Clostridia bacterium]